VQPHHLRLGATASHGHRRQPVQPLTLREPHRRDHGPPDQGVLIRPGPGLQDLRVTERTELVPDPHGLVDEGGEIAERRALADDGGGPRNGRRVRPERLQPPDDRR